MTDGETNATIPRGEDAGGITFERAVQLIADKRAKGPAPKRTTRAAPDDDAQGAGEEVTTPATSTGLFVTFEGGDGVGQDDAGGAARGVADRRAAHTVVRTREPGGTEVGVLIRDIVLHHRGDIAPRAEALLYAADRAHHIATVVRPRSSAARSSSRTATSTRRSRTRARAGCSIATRCATCRCGRPRGCCPTSRCCSTSIPTPRGGASTPTTSRSTGSRRSRPTSTHRVRAEFLALAAAEPERFLVLDAAAPAAELAADIRGRVGAARGAARRSADVGDRGLGWRYGVHGDRGDAGRAVPWGDVWGQDDAVAALRDAASDPAAMTHAWLITGPPGSGRSTLAYAFAAALIADEGDEQAMRAGARRHPSRPHGAAHRGRHHLDQGRARARRALVLLALRSAGTA